MSEIEQIVLDELSDTLEEKKENDEYKEYEADQILWKINQLEKEIEDIKQKQMESAEFYERKIESVIKQIQYRATILEGYMMDEFKNKRKKTVKTPNGTLRMTSRTVKNFGDDGDLIKFSYYHDIPTRVTEKPDKKAISEYIKKTAHIPDGYSEEKEDSFSYKTNNQQ
tara:strand:- start:3207 stop:3710 length:504 start_codon:yes stop_codon:yes gene_type:complete